MKIIKFYKDGCVPCKMVESFFDEKNVEVENVIPFDNPELSVKYGVMSVPVTVLVDDEGNIIKKSTGFNEDELTEILSLLTSDK